ncbi:MAG: RNB domain-containing ribonuclease [Bacilli bacterium]
MSSKKNISKQIKKQILNNECDYDYLYDQLVDNPEEVLSGILNSYLYLFRNVNNIYNLDVLDNLDVILNNYVRKNKKAVELVYSKIEIFLGNISRYFDYEKIIKIEKYISRLVNIQNKCIMNNIKRAKGDKYNFILFLIFEKRDIELLARYMENNMKELLINNSTIPSIFSCIIERYIEIDEDNDIEIKYFNRVINLFLKDKMYDKLIKDNSSYLKVLKTSNKKFVLDLIMKIENYFYQTREDIAKDYDVSFIIPKTEEYIYFPNGKIDLTKENILTIDNDGDTCLDDGLSIRENSDGTYTLFIHLANPASIIPYVSDTMKEALRRCNTMYLMDDNIPIFDRYLSDNILSLLPNKYTNALTIMVNVDTNYSLILDTLKIIPSIVNSRHKLTYENVDDIILHGGELNNKLLLLSKIFDKQAIDNPKISAYHRLENVIKGRSNTNSSKSDVSISHMIVEQSNVFANSTIYTISKRDNLNLIMPWRVQTEDCDKLINEYLRNGNFDVSNINLCKMMKEYMMKSRYSFVNTGHSGLGMDGYVRISSAARRAMDALAIYVLYDLYINRNQEDLDAKYYYWEREIKYWCEYANNRTSENNNFISEYNYLCSKGKILKK